jgi:hypothetical protein
VWVGPTRRPTTSTVSSVAVNRRSCERRLSRKRLKIKFWIIIIVFQSIFLMKKYIYSLGPGNHL